MQKGQTQVLILAGIVILISVAGGIFYLGRTNVPKPKTTVVTFSPQPSPTPTDETVYTESDPTANWKTYTDTNLNLRFKYPSTLIVCGSREGWKSVSIRSNVSCDPQEGPGPANNLGIADISLSIKLGEEPWFNYLKDLNIDQTKQGMTEGERMAGVTYTRTADTYIGGLLTKNYRVDGNSLRQNNVSELHSYSFGPNNRIYFISKTYYNTYPYNYGLNFDDIFDQILSTFRFTD